MEVIQDILRTGEKQFIPRTMEFICYILSLISSTVIATAWFSQQVNEWRDHYNESTKVQPSA